MDMLALLGKVRLLSSSSLHVGGGVQGPPLFPTNNIPFFNFFTINPCFFFSPLSLSPPPFSFLSIFTLSFSSKFKICVCASPFHPCCLLFLTEMVLSLSLSPQFSSDTILPHCFFVCAHLLALCPFFISSSSCKLQFILTPTGYN